jgi:hypothetical protein
VWVWGRVMSIEIIGSIILALVAGDVLLSTIAKKGN